MPTPILTLDEAQAPSPEDLRAVVRGLVAHNTTRAPPEDHRPLAAFVRGPGGEVHGGAAGYTHWGWLFVSHLWVPESLRGTGWGRRLMQAIETAALRRGCHAAHLDTFSFQSLGFYERLGYERFATLEDYPPGEQRHFLRKRLGVPAAREASR